MNVGFLDKFERGLERAFNGAFAKTFRSGLQPVEIVAALKRELDTRAAVVSRDRVLVPNELQVVVSASDYDRLNTLGNSLQNSLLDEIERHAVQQHYQFAGPISVQLIASEQLSEGQLEVNSRSVEGRVNWVPVLEVAGQRFPIQSGSNVIGRGSDAHITINDNGASRRHAEVIWDGQRAGLRDLGSTNGTKLNGRRIAQAALEPNSLIEIGRTQLQFRIVPQAEPSTATRHMHNPGGRR